MSIRGHLAQVTSVERRLKTKGPSGEVLAIRTHQQLTHVVLYLVIGKQLCQTFLSVLCNQRYLDRQHSRGIALRKNTINSVL